MDLQSKLSQLKLQLPPAPKPVAAYVPAVEAAGLLFVSGQLPMKDGQLLCRGSVPSSVTLEQAQQAARQCLLNALAIANDHLGGDWSRLTRIVRVGVFVSSDNGFTDQPKVANGASELLIELFGDTGRHARAAVGVNTLPLGAPVELELTLALSPDSTHEKP